MQDKLHSLDGASLAIAAPAAQADACNAEGVYRVKCYEYDGGPLLWEDVIENVVTTVGKNLALDTILAGSAYTVVGPYMGLISSVSYGAGPVAADTMASHAGWLEAGSTNAPTFTARIAPAWSAAAAGSKGTSTAVSFTMTGAGTLKGAFLVYGTGAVTTLMSTAGTLLSAGTFSGGDQVVSSGNVVNVSYSLGL
jgi:hypothetical protein